MLKIFGNSLQLGLGVWGAALLLSNSAIALKVSPTEITSNQSITNTNFSPSSFTSIAVLSDPIVEAKPAINIPLREEATTVAQSTKQLQPNRLDNLKTDSMAQVTSVSQLSDVQPTDWAFQALQSLVERYGCLEGYPDRTYRGNRAITRYEFAAGLNACLNRIQELIASGTGDSVRQEDLTALQRLQQEFATELASLRGRIDTLEARTARLEANQFSTITKLNGEVIWAVTDTFGNRVGGNSDDSNTIFAYRTRLNFESSFSGKDFLRTRLEFGNFGSIADVTGTNMTRLTFDTNTENNVKLAHLLYRFPVNKDLSITLGTTGIGYTDITDTLTPPGVADDARGIPSLFGEYSPLYRRGGGGGAINWNIKKNVILTLGYLAGSPASPLDGNGLFNGSYNALAQLAYYGNRGAIGVAYSRSYGPKEQVELTGGSGSLLAGRPFGDNIATSSNSIGIQGFYRVSPHFQIHGWGVYTSANAESTDLSTIPDGRGGEFSSLVDKGSNANILYGAIGLTFPDMGGKGNLSGILVGLPPRVTSSDVREEQDTSYHVEAFYRFQVNDHIAITPGFWVIFNPENDSNNDTQYVGVLRTGFSF